MSNANRARHQRLFNQNASTKTRSAAMTEDERRRMVRDADANNLIEGLKRDPSTDDIFESYIEGRIEAADLVPMLKERFGLK